MWKKKLLIFMLTMKFNSQFKNSLYKILKTYYIFAIKVENQYGKSIFAIFFIFRAT